MYKQASVVNEGKGRDETKVNNEATIVWMGRELVERIGEESGQG